MLLEDLLFIKWQSRVVTQNVLFLLRRETGRMGEKGRQKAQIPGQKHALSVFQIPVHPSAHAQGNLNGVMKMEEFFF